jgi:hypothetical protein
VGRTEEESFEDEYAERSLEEIARRLSQLHAAFPPLSRLWERYRPSFPCQG